MALRSRILFTVILVMAGSPAARAGLVTPDSIGSPVFSSSANGGSVAPGALVADQYQGSGLLFSVPGLDGPDAGYSATVIRLNNRDVFAPAFLGTFPGSVNYVSYSSPAGVAASLVLPGTTTPGMADSVTAFFDSTGPVLVQLEAFDKNGRLLKTTTAQVGGVLETPVELDVAGIQSIFATAFQPAIDPIPFHSPPPGYPYAWGVRAIEWHEAPEPAGFVLGGLGMFALLGYALRRRLMRVRLGVRGA